MGQRAGKTPAVLLTWTLRMLRYMRKGVLLMKMVIEAADRGYRVRVSDGGKDEYIAFRPYTLPEAVRMAVKALEIYNRGHGEGLSIRDVLSIDREGVLRNGDMDSLSAKMARMLSEEDTHDHTVRGTGQAGDSLQDGRGSALKG